MYSELKVSSKGPYVANHTDNRNKLVRSGVKKDFYLEENLKTYILHTYPVQCFRKILTS